MNKTQFLVKMTEAYDEETLLRTINQMTNETLSLTENQVTAVILMVGDARAFRRIEIAQRERVTQVLSYTDLLPICTYINSCR